jgi:G3E family GTPase
MVRFSGGAWMPLRQYASRQTIRCTTLCYLCASLLAMQMHQPRWLENSLIQDQLSVADVVAITKADIATAEQLQHAQDHIQSLYPPKLAVYVISGGSLPIEVLSLPRADDHEPKPAQVARKPVGSSQGDADDAPSTKDLAAIARPRPTHDKGAATHESATAQRSVAARRASPGQPARFESAASAPATCGWLFDVGDSFDEAKLLAVLTVLWRECQRVKGVFRVNSPFVSIVSDTRSSLQLQPIAYRRESRIEVIACSADVNTEESHLVVKHVHYIVHHPTKLPAGLLEGLPAAVQTRDWQAVERALIACLVL